jgi:two-component system chemotaxis response regulator CheB
LSEKSLTKAEMPPAATTGVRSKNYRYNQAMKALFHASGAAFDVIGLACSAGGLPALIKVLACFPADFPAALLIVQHLDPHHPSHLAELLDRRTPLQVHQAQGGEVLAAGQVYVAPPNHHLLISPAGTLELSNAALVNFVRPSADLLFQSLAAIYQERAIAVVLTGSGSDGSQGVQLIHRAGGMTIAQDPQTAEFSSMPSAAIESHAIHYVLPLEKIPLALISLVKTGLYDSYP